MIICVDIGNTCIDLGIFKEGKITKTYLFNTSLTKTGDEYYLSFNSLLNDNIDIKDIEAIYIASVVPSITRRIARALEKVFKVSPTLLSRHLKSGIRIKIDHPQELGQDLLCAGAAIKKMNLAPALIIDLGTATKFIVVDKNEDLVGCIIYPGVKISFDALAEKAAQLMDISFEKPESVIGKNTVASLNSGAVNGTIALITGLAKMIQDELGYPLNKIITGGYSNILKGLLPNSYLFDHHLVLKGLFDIYDRNR